MNSKRLNLLLPVIAFHIALFIILIQRYVFEFPLSEGPTIPIENSIIISYLFILVSFLPHILLSYCYITICKKYTKIFSAITLILALGYIIALRTSDPLGLIYIPLRMGLYFWIPLIIILRINVVNNTNFERMQWISLILSNMLLLFSVSIVLGVGKAETGYWINVHDVYFIAIFYLCYLLQRFTKYNIIFWSNTVLMLLAVSILEFFTPLDFMLLIMFIVAAIMFTAKRIVDRSKEVNKKQEII